jgi:hypothetical protein
MSHETLLWPAFVDLMGNIAIMLMFVLALTLVRGHSLEGQIIDGIGDAGTGRSNAELNVEIEKLNAALLASDERARIAEVQIVELGTRLNRALANRAAELHRSQGVAQTPLAQKISRAIDEILKEEGL